jgi:predicted ATPase
MTQLESALELAGLKPAEAIPLLAPLLKLPPSAKYPPSSLSPEQQRRRLLATLVELALGLTRVQPTVITTEDLHWADPSTLELIQLLVEQGAQARLLLLYTARPEFRAQWPPRAHYTQITLNRLSAGSVREMIVQVAAHNALANETVDAVIERTSGVPLFVEELTRAVLESGDAKFTGREIPVTLHDSLMARLDRLGPAKEVAQIGAVIGSEFSYQLLHAVDRKPEEDLQSALRSLTEAELLYVRGIAPDANYQFKHALIRDAAYGALLKSRRKELHRLVAHTIDQKFPELKQAHPEFLGRHWTEAGLISQAIPYWQQAGQRAVEASANQEAIGYLRQGLELVKTLPDTPHRAQQELVLQITLGTPLVASRGYGAQEVASVYTRARELCPHVGDFSLLFPVLRGLWAFHLTRAEYQTAHKLGTEFLNLAQRGDDAGLLVEGHFLVGFTLQFLGEFVAAQAHCKEGIALYDSQIHHTLAFSFGVDPGVNCLSCAPLALWSLGCPDQALQRSREALTLAHKLNHPFSMGWALIAATWLRQYRGEESAVQEQAETAISLASEQGFPFWAAWATILRGWALTTRGLEREGIRQIRNGLEVMRSADAAELASTHFLAMLAEGYAKVGKHKEGIAILEEALAAVDKTGERFYEAELYRLKGGLVLKLDKHHWLEAETCFQRGLEIARKQTAKSLELRGTTSLARLLAHQGRRDEARTMLAEIYNWFTEGFDTADLKEAKALLDELSQ